MDRSRVRVYTTWHVWPVTGEKDKLYPGIRQEKIELWSNPNECVYATDRSTNGEYLPKWLIIA